MRAAERAAGLVRQILTFARRTPQQVAPVDINWMIEDLAKMLTETFPKTIELSADLHRSLPPVLGDKTQIHQALLNLAVNARDAMPAGGQIMFKSTEVSGKELTKRFQNADQLSYACVSIQDTGSGIPENVLSRIFEPFFTTKEHGKGTGLGLSVVYGIISSMNGFIDVKSVVSEGTTFLLYLPMVQGTMSVSVEGSSPSTSCSGDETILVVEDEDALRDILVEVLEAHGYSVMAASDGEEALRLYQASFREIDLVISDLGLPKLSGYQCFIEMKKIHAQVRFIIASGYIAPRDRSVMEQSGIQMIVQKPYHPETILQNIREVLKKDKSTG
jgi:CheY-like chemotaxis protein